MKLFEINPFDEPKEGKTPTQRLIAATRVVTFYNKKFTNLHKSGIVKHILVSSPIDIKVKYSYITLQGRIGYLEYSISSTIDDKTKQYALNILQKYADALTRKNRIEISINH